MGGIGGELALLCERRFQPGESRVQHARQSSEFRFRILYVNALGKVTRRNFRGSGADLLDGPDGARSQPPAAREAEQQDDAPDGGHGPREPPEFRLFGCR